MLAPASKIIVCCGYCAGEGQIQRPDREDGGYLVCPECDGSPLSIVGRGDKIATYYWRKPVPTNQFDWCACFEDDEPNDSGSMLSGYGATESAAIEDLLRLAAEEAEWRG